MLKSKEFDLELIKEGFEMFDVENKGIINPSELKEALEDRFALDPVVELLLKCFEFDVVPLFRGLKKSCRIRVRRIAQEQLLQVYAEKFRQQPYFFMDNPDIAAFQIGIRHTRDV